jgi:DNA-binding response OmpR family regulator
MSSPSLPQPSLPLPANTEPEFVIAPGRLAVQIGDQQFVVTRTQFHILALLVTEPGRVFRRSELVERGMRTLVTERTEDVHKKDLRRKLGRYGTQIDTARGIGYRLSDRPSDLANRKRCA